MKKLSFLFIALILLGVLCHYSLIAGEKILSHPYFSVKNVIIVGCQNVSRNSIEAKAHYVKNQNIFSIDINELKDRLAEDPFVADILIRRELPETLIIELKERNPLAIIEHKKERFLLSDDGYLLKKVSEDTVGYPVLRSNFSESLHLGEPLKENAWSEVLLVLLTMRQDWPHFFSLLSSVQIYSQFKIGLTLQKLSGQIIIGPDNIEQNLFYLAKLFPHLLNTSFSVIDFRFSNKAIVTLRS